MATPEAPTPPPAGLPEIVLHAARDIGHVDTAFDAELLLSTLLGAVYAGLLPDRDQGLTTFLGRLREYLAESVEPAAPLVNAALGGPAAAEPAWAAQLGKVRATGGYAYGDRYGDQTSYLATFEYEDP